MVLNTTKILFWFTFWMFLFPGFTMAQEDLNSTFNKKHLSHASTHKVLKPIYKHPSRHRMYTNECVHDYTSQMGFEYVVLTGDCEAALGHLSGGEIKLHNFMVGVGLFFRKGPFWKNKVKNRYKFCMERMGDNVN